MKKITELLFNGRLQVTLIAAFVLVSVITIGIGAVVTSRLINDYLSSAEDDQVARDMDLAKAFYQLKLEEISGISRRLSLDPWVSDNLADALAGDAEALQTIDQQIANKITVMALGGTHLIAVLDAQGNLVCGRLLDAEGGQVRLQATGSWGDLPIVRTVMETGETLAATEIIPVDFLAQVGLAEQAAIDLIETPKAALQPFDLREGTAGLALVGIAPLFDQAGELAGEVLTVYLFNNDFTLVDRIKQVAGVDTVTIFYGDLRVSTNVLNVDGSRAVGTRVSQAVYEAVLLQGLDYKGEAFVVNDWYITQYAPLRDHLGQVVGSLYVGANRTAFDRLVKDFTNRVTLILLVCVVASGVIALPIARRIIRPITDLVDANRRLAAGDMSVSVQPSGTGELALLGQSFNNMVETLQQTQQELLHKEKLASVGQLAAGVAHEINNPLGTILLFSDMVLKETPPDSQHRSDLEMIISETNRCKRIVADLLNFSRQQEVLAQEVDLQQLADHVVSLVAHKPIYDRIHIETLIPPNIPKVQADPSQLQQVFINLLDNAAEAMQNGGMIKIEIDRSEAAYVEILISDNGPGIPEEALRKLFTPFFTTKPPGKGTGLGLSIVYGIIKMHRGQITVASQLGEGTTFTILLPVKQPTPTKGTPESD